MTTLLSSILPSLTCPAILVSLSLSLLADSSAARQQGNKVIVIDAPFPPTMTKSSLGVGLNEAEILQR